MAKGLKKEGPWGIKLDRIKRFSMKTKIMIIPRRPYMIKLMDFMMKRRKNDGHFGTT